VPQSFMPAPGAGRRPVTLLGTVAGAALLAAGLAACSGSTGQPAAAPNPSGPASGGASVPDPFVSGAPPASTAPAPGQGDGQGNTPDAPSPIGPLVLSPDQSLARKIISSAQQSLGSSTQVLAIIYQERADHAKKVIVYGGAGLPLPAGDAATKLRAMIVSAQPPSTKFASPLAVNPGRAGGSSECVGFLATDRTYQGVTRCAWLNGFNSLSLTFESFSPGEAKKLAPRILNALVGTGSSGSGAPGATTS
jgi:hypothetical protein